jgi:glucose/arabinose dehydrogenase
VPLPVCGAVFLLACGLAGCAAVTAHPDRRAGTPPLALLTGVISPDHALGADTASLGLTFYDAGLLPGNYSGGASIGQHGSWNRRPRSGYKVIFVPFRDGRPAGAAENVLSGFLSPAGRAQGRPVGVAVDRAGALLVADDVGNVIWRVTPSDPGAVAPPAAWSR